MKYFIIPYNQTSKLKNQYKIIKLPYSKSYSNRCLIMSAIEKRNVFIENISTSTDTQILIKCLKKVGIKILNKSNHSISITNSFPDCEKNNKSPICQLMTKDGGTTNRFLISFLSLGEKTYAITPSKKFLTRPTDDLFHFLKENNVIIKKTKKSIEISGPLKWKKTNIKISTDKTTQNLSSILLIKHHQLSTQQISSLENLINSDSSSIEYLKLTLELIKKFKQASLNQNKKLIFKIPVDNSSISYAFIEAYFFNSLRIVDIKKKDLFNSYDSDFFKTLLKMKMQFSIKDNILSIANKQKLHPIEVNCKNMLDSIPSLALICAYTNGTSKLLGVQNLIYKESNRLKELIKLFKKFNIQIEYQKKEDCILIHGKKINSTTFSKLPYMDIKVPKDHRMIMIASFLLKIHNGGSVNNYHHVNKSFPDFFKTFEM